MWHLIHPAVWPQQAWAKNLGDGLCPFGGVGAGSPSNTVWPGPRPTSIPTTKLHLDPSSHLATTDMAKNWGGLSPLGKGSWIPI